MKFTNPDFLWALILILLPIIIHLFNFRRFKKVYFSNIRFLKTVEQQTKKHSQLRHLIILFTRIFFIGFLVLAFAKPYVPNPNQTSESNNQKRVAVFLDNSFSMQQKGRRGSLLEEGRSMAKEIAQSYRPTDKFMLVTNNMQSYSSTFLSRDDYMSDLRDCDFQPFSTQLSNVISELTSQANINKEKPTDLFVISDFQKTSADISNWKLDSNVNLWLLPLASSGANNIYADSCWFVEPVTMQDKPIEIHFLLAKNFDEVAENITVKLMLNGFQKGVQTLDLSKRKQEIEFLFRPDSFRLQFGYLEIDDYPISFDNKFYFSFPVRKSFKVAMVNGNDKKNFIQRFYESDSSNIVASFNQNQVDYSSFVGSDILVLNGVNNFSGGLLEEVKKYTEKGGRLVFVPSAESSPEEINTFNRYFNLPELLGIDTSKIFLRDLDMQSDLFVNVFDLKNNQLPENIDLPFFKYRNRIKWSIEGDERSVMTLSDGSPLLINKKVGLGNLFYFTASVDKANSNFGRHALFIPVFYNFLLTVNYGSVLFYPIGNDQIILRNLPSQKETPFHISALKSNFDFIPGYREMGGEITFSLNENIQISGNYFLSNAGKKLVPLSFNYPKNESNLDNYTISEIKNLTNKYKLLNTEILDNQSINIGDELVKAETGLQLWKIFVLMALLFLLIELFLLRFLK